MEMENNKHEHGNTYRKMMLMLLISFFIMYAVMFLNVDKTDHIYISITRVYMSLLMVSPMALLMLIFMPSMFKNKNRNIIISVTSIIVFVIALIFLRNQVLITDTQYMRAMIPHHSSAILTSKHANISDTEVKELSEQIIKSQEKEIAQMKKILERMKNK